MRTAETLCEYLGLELVPKKKKRKQVMTNQEIKKHKEELVKIRTGLNIAENDPLEQRLIKLVGGIKKLQKLADVVGAYKYFGTGLRDIDGLLTFAEKKQFPFQGTSILIEKCAEYETICNEIHDNIIYKLQTEMMFNACASAKWSCRWAAAAAILSFVSSVAAWIAVFVMLNARN